MPQTLYDKIWNDHIVHQQDEGTTLLYVDRHLIHEVTSPQAFEGLRLAKRKVRRPNLTLAVADHNVPTGFRPFANKVWPVPPSNMYVLFCKNGIIFFIFCFMLYHHNH